MKPGLAQSSVPRSAQCVALKVVRSCLSPLRFVAVVAVVAVVALVSVVTFITGLPLYYKSERKGHEMLRCGSA